MDYYNLELDLKEMGKRIRREREYHNYTREELAEMIGVSTTFVADVESGKKAFSSRNLYIVGQILDVSVDYLMTAKKDKDDEVLIKERLRESILAPLKDCSVEQLRCMERLSRIYIDGLKANKSELKRELKEELE